MLEAQELIAETDGVYNKKYRGELLYNVLMENHGIMLVNNMIVETLDPNNYIAKLYNGNYNPEEINKFVIKMNECVKNNDREKYLSICKGLK